MIAQYVTCYICYYVTLYYVIMLFFSWLVYAVATLDELMEILFVQWMFTDIKDQDTDLINKMVLKFQTFAKYFSRFMHNREFICGNKSV